MIDQDTLTDLRQWVKAGRRQVDIQLGNSINPDYESIHVYDMDLNSGQDIKAVSEINLLVQKKRKIEALKKRMEKLELEVWELEQI